jgi:hypothetical protein
VESRKRAADDVRLQAAVEDHRAKVQRLAQELAAEQAALAQEQQAAAEAAQAMADAATAAAAAAAAKRAVDEKLAAALRKLEEAPG